MKNIQNRPGKVFLVGAGPGDPGLMTIKGLKLLRQADVVIYDRLVNPGILANVRKEALTVYAGKSRSGHTLEQPAINRMLIDEAKKSKTVVRLKGGDPFLFGRGAEEALELVRAGIPFEIVPGISSSLAVPECCGIPLTHRKLSSTLTIVTGNEDPLKDKPAVDWKDLVREKTTIVILMGLENLAGIMKKLSSAGMNKDVPVAVIQNGTLSGQTVITGTVADISEKILKANIKPPAVIVVGEVVRFRDELYRPLAGKRILVTRPEGQSEDFAALLRSMGASVIKAPLIKIRSFKNSLRLDFFRNGTCGMMVVTSVNGVEALIGSLARQGFSPRKLSGIPFAAIGPKTALRLKSYGLNVKMIPKDYSQEGLYRQILKSHPQGNIVIASAQGSRDFLEKRLKERGFKVQRLILYKTQEKANGSRIKDLCRRAKVDAVTLTSPSCVRSFRRIFTKKELNYLQNVALALIGPVSAKEARRLGLKVDVQASQYTTEGLAKALAGYFLAK